MNKFRNRLTLTLASTLVVIGSARADSSLPQSGCLPSFWTHIQSAAKHAVAGGETTFRQVDERSAHVEVAGRTFALVLHDSPLADAGDLNDVTATEIEGACQLELRAVPAFGDLYEALGVNQPEWSIEDRPVID